MIMTRTVGSVMAAATLKAGPGTRPGLFSSVTVQAAVTVLPRLVFNLNLKFACVARCRVASGMGWFNLTRNCLHLVRVQAGGGHGEPEPCLKCQIKPQEVTEVAQLEVTSYLAQLEVTTGY